MRLWPRSLVGRAIAVLLLGVTASNLVALAVYTGDRFDLLTTSLGRRIADRVSAAAEALQSVPAGERQRLLRAQRGPGLRLLWSETPLPDKAPRSWQERLIRRAFASALGESGDAGRLHLAVLVPGEGSAPAADDVPPPGVSPAPPPGVSPAPPPGLMPTPPTDAMPTPPPGEPPYGPGPGFGPGWAHGFGPGHPPGGAGRALLTGSLRLDDGTWLTFAAPLEAFRPAGVVPFLLALVANTLIVVGVSAWALRRASAPLHDVAEAAERLGADVSAPMLQIRGPSEVVKVALAFNRMQQRLQGFVRDRTQMLAAISHDLRTPLTRLRLRAEFIDDAEQQRKMLSDLDEMQAMLAATLSFARDAVRDEPVATLDLAVLLQTICDESEDAGADAQYEGPRHVPFAGRPVALKRAFSNLVGNAVTYGARARIVIDATASAVAVDIDDEGPGIPDAEMERVFEPFYRLDPSRGRAGGGVGLGLSVARTIIATHGGTLRLINLASGGLRASVRLPHPR